MTAMRRSLGVGTVLMLSLGLAACTASAPEPPAPTSPVVQLGAPGEPNETLSPEDAAKLEAPKHVEADSDFMLDMIAHHDQAILMTGLVDERTSNRDIRLLAERMKVSQVDELVLMKQWLKDRAVPVNDVGAHEHDDGDPMPGMLTEAQIERLEAATGAEFERLFLEGMIQHHQGALQMVDELYAAGGGNESDTDQFARHVESDQGVEIARMQQMLAERTR